MAAMPDDGPPLAERIGEAANVLLLASDGTGAEDRICIDLLTVAAVAEVAGLSVSFTRPPADRLAVWERYAPGYPAQAAFVTVHGVEADVTRAVESVRDALPATTGVAVDRIDNPGDLRRLGERISDRLESWADGGHQIVMCFHSLTTVARNVDLERLYRFVHVHTHRIEAVDGVAHYHLDPDPLDPATVELLDRLVDVTVELDSEGWPRLRT